MNCQHLNVIYFLFLATETIFFGKNMPTSPNTSLKLVLGYIRPFFFVLLFLFY